MPRWSRFPWVWGAVVAIVLLIGLVPPGLLIFVLVAGGMGALYFYYPHVQRARALEELAQRTGGRFHEDACWLDDVVAFLGWDPSGSRSWALLSGPFRESRVEYVVRDRTIVLDILTPLSKRDDATDSDRGNRWATRLHAPFLSPDGFRFELWRTDYRGPHVFGLVPLRVGDPAFDGAFRVAATSETKARGLFGDVEVQRILAAARPRRIWLDAATCTVQEDSLLRDPARVEALRTALAVLLDRLASPDLLDRRGLVVEIGDTLSRIAASRVASATSTGATSMESGRASRSEDVVNQGSALAAIPSVRGEGPAASEQNDLPSVGDTVASAEWEVTLLWYGPYEQLAGQPPPTGARRKLVAVELTVKNLQRWTGTLTTSSLAIEDASGRATAPAGITASMERGFWLSWIPAGERVVHRAAFEVDADAVPVTLKVFGLRFRLPT